MKRQLPLILTLLVALYIIFGNFTFIGHEKEMTGTIDRYQQICSAAFVPLGILHFWIDKGKCRPKLSLGV